MNRPSTQSAYVCVVLPLFETSGSWTCQQGPHRRKVAQDCPACGACLSFTARSLQTLLCTSIVKSDFVFKPCPRKYHRGNSTKPFRDRRFIRACACLRFCCRPLDEVKLQMRESRNRWRTLVGRSDTKLDRLDLEGCINPSLKIFLHLQGGSGPRPFSNPFLLSRTLLPSYPTLPYPTLPISVFSLP